MYKLRELEREDLHEINKWRNDSELIDLLGAPFRYINMDVEIKWYENYIENRGNTVRCAIVDDEKKNKILGLVSLVNIDYINQTSEFHILIGDKENQGKGIGTFAVQTMLYHAFYNMNLQRIELMALASNKRAQRLYEKTGFILEGIKRKAKYKNGEYTDLYLYSILKNEYKYSGGGTDNLSSYSILLADLPQLKRYVIKKCDSAFNVPIQQREYYPNLFAKMNAAAEFLVAYNSDILGYAAMYANNMETRIAYITLLGVRPQYQKTQVGKRLVRACEEIAAQRGMKQLKLEVLKENKQAIGFYKHIGFVNIDESDNSFYMLKNL